MMMMMMAGREVEYLSLTRDTTESDLKQRREIVTGQAIYIDQPPVRAAIHGRVLILDGIEKAEVRRKPRLPTKNKGCVFHHSLILTLSPCCALSPYSVM